MAASALETVRVPYPVGGELQRWLEFVTARGRVAYEWIVKGVWHYRGADTRWYFWKYVERPRVDDSVARRAAAEASEAVKKRQAAPSWQEIIDQFGEAGAERNAAGEVVGYRYPKPKSDEERKAINAAVYEMWEPHRRVSTDLGMEKSANVEVTELVDPRTGRTRQVKAKDAAKVARKAKLVEKRRRLKARKSGRNA